MQGYLTKPNKTFGSKKRFFVLDQSTLTYYETEARGEKLADIFLNAQTRVSAVDANQIDIENVSVGIKSSAQTSYTLMCDIVPQQRDQWVAALKNACNPEPPNNDERLKKEADEAKRIRLLREAEEAEQLKLQLEEARIEAQRRESDGGSVGDVSAAAAHMAQFVQPSPQSALPPPEGKVAIPEWVQLVDPTGRTYYQNNRSQQVPVLSMHAITPSTLSTI
jgi:hypothetical protein